MLKYMTFNVYVCYGATKKVLGAQTFLIVV